ncbi:MAG: hypothetical protein ISS36_00110 [Candidatus Aenigmarchaeota archaeon]|nr:hypothetical protein [Candidatus Aenigmarchaeota archaeon]
MKHIKLYLKEPIDAGRINNLLLKSLCSLGSFDYTEDEGHTATATTNNSFYEDLERYRGSIFSKMEVTDLSGEE